MLAEAVDAVSDALMAEGMHQLVRGNPVRAASTVESIAGGETPPPELEVVRTPRTGIAVTHRVLTLFSGEPAPLPEWKPQTSSFRASAEPHLNAWAGKLLGSPANVRCVVELFEPDTGKVLDSKELRLDQLRLAPLDFIYAIEGGPDGQQGEIEQRILYTIARKSDGFAPGSPLRVSVARKPEWKTSELGYGEFGELLRTARKLLTSVRGIDENDLNLPERNSDFSVDVVELEKRAAAAENALDETLKKFDVQLAKPNVNLETLRDLIMLAAGVQRGWFRAALRCGRFALRSRNAARPGNLNSKRTFATLQTTRSLNRHRITNVGGQTRFRVSAFARRFRQGFHRVTALHGNERRRTSESSR